jgi:hypothetical protein
MSQRLCMVIARGLIGAQSVVLRRGGSTIVCTGGVSGASVLSRIVSRAIRQ